MAHYAFLDENNFVYKVIVGVDETETIEGLDPETWYGNREGKVCKRTSYNHKIRKQYAGIGYKYDALNDVFISPQPYKSWILDENFNWKAPINAPEGRFYWDEENYAWKPASPLP